MNQFAMISIHSFICYSLFIIHDATAEQHHVPWHTKLVLVAQATGDAVVCTVIRHQSLLQSESNHKDSLDMT